MVVSGLYRRTKPKLWHDANVPKIIDFDGKNVYSCSHCRTHLTMREEMISKAFQGHNGRAFLFNSAINVSLGPKEERYLITGPHVVCDVHCVKCDNIVGWKYERAPNNGERYKVGKFIFEKRHLTAEF
mmetsp:Transcript_11839/g.13645  ORF Transcript_11839/g.13645 Transcript_11839/m.13645 type:complete len:128 (+) Transcript_11839:199-582(+)